jgi:hypothetical protein
MIEQPRISRTAMRTIVWLTSNIFRFKNLPDETTYRCLPIVKAGVFLDEP